MEGEKGGSLGVILLVAVLGLASCFPIVSVGAVALITDMDVPDPCSSNGSGQGDNGVPSVPNDWGGLVVAASEVAGIPAAIAAAQLQQESGWDPNAVSNAGAQGLAQFMPATWETYGEGGNPFDPEDSIAAYGRYMAALKLQVESLAAGNEDMVIQLMLAAYNAGPGAVAEHQGIPPFVETQKYIEMILALSQSNFSPGCDALPGGDWDGDLGNGEWTNPLPGGTLTSGYGRRDVEGLPEWAQNHVGVDLSTSSGMGDGGPVIAPTDIRITGFNDADGCVIAKEDGTDPDFGFAFCHMNSYPVNLGDQLKRGDVIGTEGNKAALGQIGTHLHFEIYDPEAPDVVYPYEGWNLDPEPILKEKGAWPE